ncbi:HWE histidine kinase domain-containing protein [Hyphomonas sp.]|uniref:HWE histidine kinase domain-containing protein n=1 Tax=Hyphomonas sp. TaxID=87 RepID=UPI00391956AC
MDDPPPAPSELEVLSVVAVPIVVLDRQLRITFLNDAYARTFSLNREAVLGCRVEDLFHEMPERKSEVRARFERALTGETTREPAQPWRLPNEHGVMVERYWRATETPIYGPDGEVTHIVHTVDDVTEEVRLRRQADAISHELEHRLSNTLTMVGSLAIMTSRNATDIDGFVDRFMERLQNVNRTLLTISGNAWQGLSMRRVLEIELAQVAPLTDPRIHLEGPDFQLSVRSTKWTALLAHEMITNAVRYGCFSVPDGTLTVKWWVENSELIVDWSETGRCKKADPDREGFGTKMLNLMPNMTAERQFTDNGMHLCLRTTAGFIRAGLEPSDAALLA